MKKCSFRSAKRSFRTAKGSLADRLCIERNVPFALLSHAKGSRRRAHHTSMSDSLQPNRNSSSSGDVRIGTLEPTGQSSSSISKRNAVDLLLYEWMALAANKFTWKNITVSKTLQPTSNHK